MSARLIDFLLSREPRERLLLAALILVVLPLALVFGLLLPMKENQFKTQRDYQEALQIRDWLEARVVEKNHLMQAPRLQFNAAIGTSGIEESLKAANLRDAVSELSAGAGGSIEIQFDQVDFLRLANWLSRVHPAWGYQIESLRFEALDAADPSGKIAAWLTLMPQTPS